MSKSSKSSEPNQSFEQKLKKQLERKQAQESQETLRAIQENMVDAFVVTRENGNEVLTLSGADFPYRRMVESMNEGAVTVIPDGTIFYCNPRFAEVVHVPAQDLIGRHFQDLLLPEQQAAFQAVLREAKAEGSRSEFSLKAGEHECVPVQCSFYRLRSDESSGIAILATDISERKEAEERIRALASELTIAEQEERHRISQILHDDLQQRLFAIRAQLSFLLGSLPPAQIAQDAQASIEQVQGWLSEAINITRNLSVDISPSVLHGEGISEAIRWLSVRMKEQYGLQLEIQIEDDLRNLPDHMRVTLFQVVREILFNVVKHADTLNAVVTLERLDEHGCITVRDRGKGFEPAKILSDPQAAHGLIIVRDRLNLMGSSLDVHSIPGDGTEIKVRFPIEPLTM